MERNDLLKTFGSRVKDLRTQKDLSQEAFADICKLDRTYISGIERGLRNPSLTGIFKVAEGLGIDAGTLIQGMCSEHER